MAQDTKISIAYKIEGVDGGFKKLTVDAEAFRKLMEANVTEVEKMKKSFMDFAVISNGIKNFEGSVNALTGALTSVTGENMEFDKAMKAANTMAGKDSEGFRKLKDEVAELAKQLPIARDELANGLYQVISNGVPESNWLEYLQTSAKSAVGGIADINKVVGVTSTVIKNYGMEWSAAADIQDKIQLTAKNGVTSFEQLAQALPRVTGNAATLGVTIDELLGTFATLTGVSGNTAEVSTQLAAIFTALVKPSSEAAKMAAQMGIQFDAAAIKAAGGFQQFLTQLDKSIKAYATANGVLEQEVYSKLFGSAESLRALIPLQGELADKFTDNVSSMVNSAGTMEAAFNDMASTGEAVTQMLRNKLAAFLDVVAGVTSAAQPYVTFTAALLTTASNAMILVEAMKQLHITQYMVALRTKLLSGLLVALGHKGKSTAVLIRVFSGALKGGAYSATAFKIALRGLVIATGVGAAIYALTSVISFFVSSADKASEKTQKLIDTEEQARSEAERYKRIQEEENSIKNKTKALIDVNIAKLKAFNGTKEEEKKLVNEMNNTYGDTMGYFSSVASWYDALIANSEAYCRQMVLETRTRKLANLIAEKEQSRDDLQKSIDSGELSTQRETREKSRASANSYYQTGAVREEIIGTSELEQAQQKVETIDKDLNDLNGQLKSVVEVASTLDFKVKGSNTRPDLGENNKGVSKYTEKEKTRLQEINDLIAKSKEKYINTSDSEREEIRKNILELNKEKQAIEQLYVEAERPTTLSTFEDIAKEISYQRTLRQKAKVEDIAGIDAEIKRLEDLREERELSAHTPVPIEEIQTYKQLNDELSYYNALLQSGSEEVRIFARKNINALNEVKEKWDKTLVELKKPGDISTLDTIGKLEEAINFYQARQKEASEDEIQEIQKTIDAYERKRNALQRGIEIPSMLREADDINRLTGREYKLKIRSMGFEELTEKIRELQKMLNDMDHPVTETQRRDIESLISTYEKWRREGIDTFETFRNGWGSVKGIGDSVDSLTDTIEGNGNAWQKLTGIVDGFIQIYEGIKAIIGIINTVTTATEHHTAATIAETSATSTQTSATIAQTSATIAETSASTANTAAKSSEAVANATSSGAKMPFPINIAAIAAGVAAVVGALAVVGKFADGGIVGGNSPTGDRLLARVNSGEMILNKSQQSNLFSFIRNTGANIRDLGIPRFAAGGIVSGPTLGLVGEYAGAKNNPEVIAPLNKLRDLIGNDENGANGRVEFEIRGDRLYGLLRKYERNKNRT